MAAWLNEGVFFVFWHVMRCSASLSAERSWNGNREGCCY